MLKVYKVNIKSVVKKYYLVTLSLSKQIQGSYFQLNHGSFRYHFHFFFHYHLKF
jgi:hypothetical protein